jgi:hypothetical protein
LPNTLKKLGGFFWKVFFGTRKRKIFSGIVLVFLILRNDPVAMSAAIQLAVPIIVLLILWKKIIKPNLPF